MKRAKIVHLGTGVLVDRFPTKEEAQRWLDQYSVSQSYKDTFYTIVEE